jgi:hypothetical protein
LLGRKADCAKAGSETSKVTKAIATNFHVFNIQDSPFLMPF